jgi:DhnA family fructose-bisphosphate aldolase class Ia
VVIAEGKKLPKPEALELVSKAVQRGAVGVDPRAKIQILRAVVHQNAATRQALEL